MYQCINHTRTLVPRAPDRYLQATGSGHVCWVHVNQRLPNRAKHTTCLRTSTCLRAYDMSPCTCKLLTWACVRVRCVTCMQLVLTTCCRLPTLLSVPMVLLYISKASYLQYDAQRHWQQRRYILTASNTVICAPCYYTTIFPWQHINPVGSTSIR